MSSDIAVLRDWLKEHRITEVELLVPDMAAIARGKILPTSKFLAGLDNDTLRLPESIFGQMVTGADAETSVLRPQSPDMILAPDAETICIVPWYREPTAQVICDCLRKEMPVQLAPRQVLKNVLKLYADKGWRPVVAPELEFFLSQKNIDADYPLLPPAGKSGRPQTGRQAYSIDAVNEFDPLFEDVYDFCEKQEIGIDSLIHEEGGGAGRNQFQSRRSVTACRSNVPVQAHGAASRPAPRHLRDVHGQALRARAGQRHAHPSEHLGRRDRPQYFRDARRQGYAAVHVLHRRPAEISAGGDAANRALCEFLSPFGALSLGAGEYALGAREPHRGLAHSGNRKPRTGGSRTACRAPTPILISRSRPRSPAAIWA